MKIQFIIKFIYTALVLHLVFFSVEIIIIRFDIASSTMTSDDFANCHNKYSLKIIFGTKELTQDYV